MKRPFNQNQTKQNIVTHGGSGQVITLDTLKSVAVRVAETVTV